MKTSTKIDSQKALQLLGKAIKQRRKVLKLTQTELARLADMSVNLVCQIENGKATVQACKLLDLISVMGLHFVLANGQARIFLSGEFLQ